MFESEQFWADFENDGIERVYIEPPDDKEESDEDSGDESGGSLDNLAGRQLASSAEMVLQSGKRFGFEEDDENFSIIENNGNPPDQDYDEEDDLPLARKDNPSVMQLQFRKEIAQIYLKKKIRTFQNPVDDLRHILQIVESRPVLGTTGSTTSLNTSLIIREDVVPETICPAAL
ncbi:hypothetical protein JTB14_024387 [Gonioctena quinquepunctata]|nr:hypothetical protein JTB14_024387 [Gonioctena quinquepunctata]